MINLKRDSSSTTTDTADGANQPATCPFFKVEKDIGHDPYYLEMDGLWQVQCTCGARGPISATQDCAAKAWARR